MTSLDNVLRGLEAKIGGVTLVKENDLKYHLADSEGNQLGDTINIAQETFLDRVELVTLYMKPNKTNYYVFY